MSGRTRLRMYELLNLSHVLYSPFTIHFYLCAYPHVHGQPPQICIFVKGCFIIFTSKDVTYRRFVTWRFYHLVASIHHCMVAGPDVKMFRIAINKMFEWLFSTVLSGGLGSIPGQDMQSWDL
jgi:hypothetical protein